ncbi:MAG: GNAT family N-acetyltransferase, partial [Syntrophales bacterium LBB04]|nr:GNAT family N-acetyltransferase [Syntrophales bacterium LBB04]
GDIGLFAVDAAMRRKNLGVSLVHTAQEWAHRRGLKSAQVVTQEKNVAACRLYEKCGYRIDKVEFFYHFWIS